MLTETKLTLMEIVNEITQLNGRYLAKLRDIEKANGVEKLSEEQGKCLIDASMKLVQANSKIIESCK